MIDALQSFSRAVLRSGYTHDIEIILARDDFFRFAMEMAPLNRYRGLSGIHPDEIEIAGAGPNFVIRRSKKDPEKAVDDAWERGRV